MRFLLFVKPFFNFEKLHRHTLKTLFTCERHINGLPSGGRRKEMTRRCPPFLPFLLPMWFYPFQSPTYFPLKTAWGNIRQNKATSPLPWCHPSFLPSSFLLVILHPHRHHHSFFFCCFFFLHFLVIIFHFHVFFLFVGTVRCRKSFLWFRFVNK